MHEGRLDMLTDLNIHQVTVVSKRRSAIDFAVSKPAIRCSKHDRLHQQ